MRKNRTKNLNRRATSINNRKGFPTSFNQINGYSYKKFVSNNSFPDLYIQRICIVNANHTQT